MENRLLYISNIADKRMTGSFNGTAISAAQDLGKEFICVANRSKTTESDTKLDEEKWGIRLLHIDLSRSPCNLIQNYKAYKQLVKIIQEYEIEYIHCNTPVGGIVGRLAGKKCKVKKVIYQAHGFHFYKGAPLLNRTVFKWAEQILAHYTDALITINKEDFEFAKNNMKLRNGGKVYYVPGVGIDIKQYDSSRKCRDEKRAELNIPQDAFVIISVGELNVNKNNSVIISALEKLGKEIHYLLCGNGDCREALQRQADDAGLHNNVHFLGYRNDVNELYAASDCFIISSFREGLPRSLMEAMASGLPCIASRIRGNVDLIEDGKGGYLCDTTDTAAFAEKINILADNAALRDEMGKSNLITIQGFSTEVVEKEMKAIYNAEFASLQEDKR